MSNLVSKLLCYLSPDDKSDKPGQESGRRDDGDDADHVDRGPRDVLDHLEYAI